MQCLPEKCVPLCGSKGEEWRENQFMNQLPSYDMCLDACHDMIETDKKRMTKFVDMRRKKFFGVGEVETLLVSKVPSSCTTVNNKEGVLHACDLNILHFPHSLAQAVKKLYHQDH